MKLQVNRVFLCAISMALSAALSASCHGQVVTRVSPVVLSVAPGGTGPTPATYTAPTSQQNTGHVVPTVLPACYDCPALAGLVPLPASGAGPCSCTQSPGISTPSMRSAPSLKPVMLQPPVPVNSAPRVLVLRPIIPLVPPAPPSGYVVGRGLIGQPTLYLPGQPIRNFLRYLSP